MSRARFFQSLRRKPYLLTAILFTLTLVLSYSSERGRTPQVNEALRKSYVKEPGKVLGFRRTLRLPTPATRPEVIAPPPQIDAKAAIVLEPNSHTILFEKNAHRRLPPASTTKIATAIVILETQDLNRIVTVPQNLIAITPGSWMGLQPQQKITLKKLLEGMLIHSGNDAAFTLAATYSHPANNPQEKGVTDFVRRMNSLVSRLNLKDTHFTNPIGFDNPQHYSSAYDLAVLASYAMKNPEFARIVGTPRGNTNLLLKTVAGVNGVKTGHTPQAGGVLVVSVNRENHPLIVVVMGSQKREVEATRLIEWAYRSTRW